VLDAQHRDQRARDRERPVAQVDLLVADLVAPARPAQLGDRDHADREHDERQQEQQRAAGRGAADDERDDRGDQPLRPPQPARGGGEAAGGLWRHGF
jgi:hypothetical protein